MRTLSIRQPWAWLIIHGGKDIENRDWRTAYRGRILVHASATLTRRYYAAVQDMLLAEFGEKAPVLPPFEQIERGGIIGSVEITDCVSASLSRWFMGNYGFVLREPQPLPFTPFKGQLGFFDAPMPKIAALEPH